MDETFSNVWARSSMSSSVIPSMSFMLAMNFSRNLMEGSNNHKLDDVRKLGRNVVWSPFHSDTNGKQSSSSLEWVLGTKQLRSNLQDRLDDLVGRKIHRKLAQESQSKSVWSSFLVFVLAVLVLKLFLGLLIFLAGNLQSTGSHLASKLGLRNLGLSVGNTLDQSSKRTGSDFLVAVLVQRRLDHEVNNIHEVVCHGDLGLDGFAVLQCGCKQGQETFRVLKPFNWQSIEDTVDQEHSHLSGLDVSVLGTSNKRLKQRRPLVVWNLQFCNSCNDSGCGVSNVF
ncbi:hypothetical protein OGAPHI_000054 [Ogataea philodendri]|uniref:Uncharacterized protein n=1 Tax=Ogataea philodendri TaxID=1378263 RepID=A0A9P8T9Z4_9ASCO|nr:uncharacterized protein OGAPHI_000054 [Ogataea philodendri]KAH3671868.1 hypothetical protein OGAPHI_000054 [Ogataea philodendri]